MSCPFLPQGNIFSMFRELFEAAVSKPSPRGIPPSPQSRAMYAVDLLLKWDTNNTGKSEHASNARFPHFNHGGRSVVIGYMDMTL